MTTCLSRLKEVRYLTSQIQTLFCVILIVTLAACGGGRPIAEAAAAKEGTAEGTAVSLQAERRTGAFVASVLAMGERRSSPTTVDYLFGIEIQNGDVPQQYVIARVIRAGEATTIIDGEIRLDEILAGARVTPKGTIRLRHDSSKPFDPESIEWEVTGLSMLLPIQEGAELTTPDLGRALFGEAFEALVRVVPTDGRNQVLSYEISNSTVEGSPPVIDAKGRLTWKPNQADFDNTKTLRLVARLASGPAATFDVAVLVAKERLIHEVTLPPLGGSIADSHGRYLIRVEREKGVNALKGALSIVEVYASDGSYIYTIRVSPESGARIKVLDAPLLSARANGPTASGQRKVQISAESTRDLWDCVINGEPGPASDTLSPDIGAYIGALSGDFGQAAHGVITTRNESFTYFWKLGTFGPPDEYTSSEARKGPYQVDGNCRTAKECAAIASEESGETGSPVILVHGFNFGPCVGGGAATWGQLAPELKRRGHPVFELRWNTRMRFEEAAGVLAMLANRVASITGYKVSVIAHSFGGVVAHQALMGQGIRYDGADRWVRVPVDGVFQRLITLGSPLSGISDNSNVSLGLTAGRDESDVSIGACPQITCFQAGSTDWDAREVDNFARIIEGLDPERVGMPDSWQGASIRALHDGWTIGAAHSVPFSTVVSLRHRPIADLTPDLTNETAFRLGDGLISLMGQAVIPSDFSESPFASKEELNILDSELGTSFLEDVDGRFGSNLLYRSIGGRDYFFAMRATHTARHFSLESRGQAQFPVANFGVNPMFSIDYSVSPAVAIYEGYHALAFFVESKSQLAEDRVPYGGPPALDVLALVRGRILSGGAPAQAEIWLQIERTESGSPVGDAIPTSSVAATGEFAIDVGPALQTALGPDPGDLSRFSIVLRLGDGSEEGSGLARVLVRRTLSELVDFGSIDATLVEPADFVDANGLVVGSTSGAPIAGATVFLMQGEGQLASLVRAVVDTSTTRRLTTNALGHFSAASISPGIYTVLVVKEGYQEEYLEAARIDGEGILSVSMELSFESSFFDDFEGPSIDPSKWTVVLHPSYPGTNAVQSGGELNLAVGAWVHTSGHAAFRARKVVVEGVLGSNEASFLLLDSFEPTTGGHLGVVMGSDTAYRGWGFNVQASGRYGIVSPAIEGDVTVAEGQNVLVNWSHSVNMHYRRMTIEGDHVVFERGASADDITDRISARMTSSIEGRPLTLVLGTGVGPYTPGRFQWVRLTASP